MLVALYFLLVPSGGGPIKAEDFPGVIRVNADLFHAEITKSKANAAKYNGRVIVTGEIGEVSASGLGFDFKTPTSPSKIICLMHAPALRTTLSPGSTITVIGDCLGLNKTAKSVTVEECLVVNP